MVEMWCAPASAGAHRRTLGGQQGPGSKPCQGRQPPKAGAEGQPLRGLLVGHTRATEFDG
jgi:hypothetical protein